MPGTARCAFMTVPFVGRLKSGQSPSVVSNQLQQVLSEFANQGWEFVGIHKTSISVQPGCLGSLFGGKASSIRYDQLEFKRLEQTVDAVSLTSTGSDKSVTTHSVSSSADTQNSHHHNVSEPPTRIEAATQTVSRVNLWAIGAICAIVILFILGQVTGRSKAPTAVKSNPERATPTAFNDTRLHLRGVGPIQIGMSTAEANAAVGGNLVALGTPPMGGCSYMLIRHMKEGVAVMINNGRVARIDVTSPAYPTVSGARVGMAQDQVMQLYGGRLQVAPHTYVQSGKYLTFVPRDAVDQSYRMIIDTDGAKVTGIRAGQLPEVEWIEGCH